MFSFFKKRKPSSAASVQLKLISIHIPKTAGTSFRNTLKAVYGEDHVIRLDIKDSKLVVLDNVIFGASTLPISVNVIHGHFSFSNLIATFPIDPSTPLITWLRDPVERVISNYYYLQQQLSKEETIEQDDKIFKGVNILSNGNLSLLEYARLEKSRNRMSRFLDGCELSDFTFIGIQEFYSEDLKELSILLNWPQVQEFHHNTTENRHNVDALVRAEIEALNLIDVDIYQNALAIRSLRRNR